MKWGGGERGVDMHVFYDTHYPTLELRLTKGLGEAIITGGYSSPPC